MRITLLTMGLFFSLTASASSLTEYLKDRSCSVKFNKTVFINDSDSMIELGSVMFAPLMNERNVLFKKGSLYEITESDAEVIVIAERTNIIFLCITDESKECVNLSQVESSDFKRLANNQLELVCK